ncbi:MAG: PhzF family phenazine biosynthesis protein [Casimicrobiaceae bacterium]
MDFAYRLVNVFAETSLGGNPLCVFENAEGLDDATLQALALQFNLSETTFLLPSTRASARVRIFTPTFEMPFAGHPTLGTAHVVRALRGGGDDVTLEMRVGVIAVSAVGDRWTLTANAPKSCPCAVSPVELAAMLGLAEADMGTDALWVDTGSDQLMVPLTSFAAVRRAAPEAAAMRRCASNGTRAMAYVFARDGNHVLARFFFPKHGSVIEDPGTGSACANLGGWLLVTGATLPQTLQIDQGEAVGRPCRLALTVSAERTIHVGGRVVDIGKGAITL